MGRFLRPTLPKTVAIVVLAMIAIFSNWCFTDYIPFESGVAPQSLELRTSPTSFLCDNSWMNESARIRVFAFAPLLLLLHDPEPVAVHYLLVPSTVLVLLSLYLLVSLALHVFAGKWRAGQVPISSSSRQNTENTSPLGRVQ